MRYKFAKTFSPKQKNNGNWQDQDFYDEKFNFLPKVLLIILASVVAIITLGTIINIATRDTAIGSNYRHSDPEPQKVIKNSKKTDQSVDAYTAMGQLRINTKGAEENTPGALLVVSPWFTYPSADTALFEELQQKERQEKSLITNYFSRFTKEDLLARGEATVKTDIVELINSQLVMGKVRAVYFDQYTFFE